MNERIIAEKGGAGFEGIKLLLCENPLPPLNAAIEAAKAELPHGNFYTEAFSAPLRKALSERLGVAESFLHINAGSELILRQLFDRFGQRVHLFSPTYALFPGISRTYTETRLLPEDDFAFDLSRLEIPPETTLTVIVNPNNPNGGAFDMAALPDLLRRHRDTLFLVDEAFIDLGGVSVVMSVPRYKNLLVTRTFSKAHSLAGFRVGYVVAPEPIARDLNASNDAYPLARPSQAAALATLKHPDQIRKRGSQLKAWTMELMADLGGLGLKCYPTETYFFLANVSPIDGMEFARRLRERHILVKPIEGDHLSGGYVRMTTSTPENNRRVVQAVGEVIDRLNRLSDP